MTELTLFHYTSGKELPPRVQEKMDAYIDHWNKRVLKALNPEDGNSVKKFRWLIEQRLVALSTAEKFAAEGKSRLGKLLDRLYDKNEELLRARAERGTPYGERDEGTDEVNWVQFQIHMAERVLGWFSQ